MKHSTWSIWFFTSLILTAVLLIAMIQPALRTVTELPYALAIAACSLFISIDRGLKRQ